MAYLRVPIVSSLLFAALISVGYAAVYRVGPNEQSHRISEVVSQLMPGDVVEVTGDISDHVEFASSGTARAPITIRGVVHTAGGRKVRPVMCLDAASDTPLFSCAGGHVVIENLELTGQGLSATKTALGVRQTCDHLTLRNCYFHHFSWKAVLSAPRSGSITIEFCEFDSCGSVALNGKPVDVWSWTPGAVMRVEHCYFHDSLNECHLKTHCTRNIVRYNWFEDSYNQAIKITDRIGGYEPERPEGVYPMHSDIVGNVFIQGHAPGSRFSLLSVGGQGADETGIEGDITLAHNLFVMTSQRANAFPGAEPNAVVLVQGNVDRLRLFNNVFVEMGGPGSLVYMRGETWESPETRGFVKRRGNGEPSLEGSNNWVFERSTGMPEAFGKALRGLNPKFADLLRGDYRPRKDSPLAGAGLWPLPKGRIVDLVPEYEPQRGIPADLKPRPRRKVTPPSIGPFEAPEE